MLDDLGVGAGDEAHALIADVVFRGLADADPVLADPVFFEGGQLLGRLPDQDDDGLPVPGADADLIPASEGLIVKGHVPAEDGIALVPADLPLSADGLHLQLQIPGQAEFPGVEHQAVVRVVEHREVKLPVSRVCVHRKDQIHGVSSLCAI